MAVSALVLGLAVVPAASAATDVVTIANPGNGIGFPDLAQVELSVTSTTPLTVLNVTLTSAANPDALSFTIADFSLRAGGTSTDGTWVFSGHIADSQLPLGIYTIEITAGDSGGGSASNDLVSLDWLIQPSLTITASQTVITYDNPSVTFSGNLSLTDPDGTQVPASDLAGQPLVLTDNIDHHDIAVTTNSVGGYSFTVEQPFAGAAYFTELSATATTIPGTSPSIWISATQDPTEVSAQASATQLSDGQTLTITGTAEYNPGSGFVPLQNSTVQIYDGEPINTGLAPTATAVTNSQGAYSASFPADVPGQYYIAAGGLPGSPFLDEVLVDAIAKTPYVHVTLPLQITGLHSGRSSSAILTLTGCLIGGGVEFPRAPVLQAEYAKRPSGPWYVLSTVQGVTSRYSDCGTGAVYGEPFKYRVPAAVAAAYYRLSGTGGPDFEPTVSQVVHAVWTPTRITGFRISPRSVRKTGTVITVSGRLWEDTRGWHPLAGQKVRVLFRYKGTWYYFRREPHTDASGRFSGRFTAYLGGPFVAVYMGSKAYFVAATAQLKVTATSSSDGTQPAAKAGWRLSASLRPARARRSAGRQGVGHQRRPECEVSSAADGDIRSGQPGRVSHWATVSWSSRARCTRS